MARPRPSRREVPLNGRPRLIVIVPNVTPNLLREFFQRALVEASKLSDMINGGGVVEIDSGEVRAYELLKLE